MRAAIFDGVGQPLRIASVSDPAPMPQDVIIKVHVCGICGSDLHMTSGDEIGFPTGCIMGHEFAGEVVASGRMVKGLEIGDRVAVLPASSCGNCAACLMGTPARCPSFQALGCGKMPGGYAEYVRVAAAYCLPLAPTLNYEDGALTEPLAVALRGVGFASLRPGSRILVLGVGPIGLSVIFWARRMGGYRIVAAAPTGRRADLAAVLGADDFVELQPGYREDVLDKLGGAPDVIFECAGQNGSIATALDLIATGGTVVVLGLCTTTDSFHPAVALLKEVTVRFSIVYDLMDYGHALATLAAGAQEPKAIISDRISLNELPSTFEGLRQRNKQCKVLVRP